MLMNEIQKQRGHRFAQLIGLELKAQFVRNSISQTSIADQLGHSRTSFSKWINAKPSIPIEALLNVCEILKVDPREIVDTAYNRLLNESVKEAHDALIDDIVDNPDNYDIAANHDKNKEIERETPRD